MSEPILFREILQQHQALSDRGWAIVFGALGIFFTGFGLAMFGWISLAPVRLDLSS